MTWASEAILEANCHGTVSIDGHSLNRDAWAVLNAFVLWQSADRGGEDFVVPGSHDALANPRWRQPTSRTLEMIVVGTVDRNGTPTEDAAIGLEENISWLLENIDAPVDSATGTRTLVLTLPSGATRSAEVHVGPLQLGSVIRGAFTATLEVQMPGGQLGERIVTS